MNKILIVSNTYYQLLLAIQMKYTIFKNDYVCLLLSDHSNNANKIYENLSTLGIFDETHYIQTKGVVSKRNFVEKIIDCFSISFLKNNRYNYYLNEIDNLYFDELIFYNFGVDICGLFSVLRNMNNNLKASVYEEGILSYENQISIKYALKLIKTSNFILNRKFVTDTIESFYCFYPSFYKGNFNAIKVPKFKKNSDELMILYNLFELNVCGQMYDQKYIFFSSVYDFEGGCSIGEFNIACQIRDIVGNENLLVKIHPRDYRSVYEENGFNVDRNSSIPWEVIVLLHDFSDHVFLTINSGSALAGSLMTDNLVDTVFLYKCCDLRGNINAQKSSESIEKLIAEFKKNSMFVNIMVIDKIEDIIY